MRSPLRPERHCSTRRRARQVYTGAASTRPPAAATRTHLARAPLEAIAGPGRYLAVMPTTSPQARPAATARGTPANCLRAAHQGEAPIAFMAVSS